MTVSDIIRRSDAMGAVQDHFNADGFKGYDDGQKMMDRINALPSAETHDKRTKTHSVCSDIISREDAIVAIEEITWYHQNRNGEMVSGANSTEDQAWYKSQDIYAALEALPSAEAIHKPDYSYEAGMERRLKEALSAEAATGDYPNDLISRSALMEYCSNQKSKSIDNNDIARFPSAEAVEVVRCKDCKWHLNGHLCKQLSQYGSIETPPSFYCGFGERMVRKNEHDK